MEEIVTKVGGVIMCLFFICGFVISDAWLWGCAFGMVVTAIGLYYDMQWVATWRYTTASGPASNQHQPGCVVGNTHGPAREMLRKYDNQFRILSLTFFPTCGIIIMSGGERTPTPPRATVRSRARGRQVATSLASRLYPSTRLEDPRKKILQTP